jgi:hypothetical protein
LLRVYFNTILVDKMKSMSDRITDEISTAYRRQRQWERFLHLCYKSRQLIEKLEKLDDSREKYLKLINEGDVTQCMKYSMNLYVSNKMRGQLEDNEAKRMSVAYEQMPINWRVDC